MLNSPCSCSMSYGACPTFPAPLSGMPHIGCSNCILKCWPIPAAPGFYHKPASIDDLVDFIVARVLDHLEVEHTLGKRWGGEVG